ncbi:hypothetical protein BJ170DRAFT_347068 [Xylariales sp. AK1849]|nr:hypothetical protein BJ170DRAFT_347068 [Xylariales sp. AK1849]
MIFPQSALCHFAILVALSRGCSMKRHQSSTGNSGSLLSPPFRKVLEQRLASQAARVMQGGTLRRVTKSYPSRGAKALMNANDRVVAVNVNVEQFFTMVLYS